MCKGLKSAFLPKRKTNKHMKICSMSLVINEMQIKTTSHLLVWLWFKKKKKITSVSEEVDRLKPLCTAGWNVKWCSHCGKQFGGQTQNYHMTQKSHSEVYTQRDWKQELKADTCTPISTMDKRVQTTQSVHQQMNRYTYIISVHSGCYTKIPQARWFRNSRNILLTVLEAGSPTRLGPVAETCLAQ